MAAKKRELEHVTDPQEARVVTNARIAKVAMVTDEGTEQYMHINDFKPSKTKVKVVPSCSPQKVIPIHPDNEVVFSCSETKAMPSCLETKGMSSY